MEVLTLQQAGFLAWSKSKKNKSLFASASIYDSFSANEGASEDALLQIHSFDIINKTSSSQKMGAATFQGANFTSLDWETFGENDNFPLGIIASGFDNGVVGLWDPNAIIQNSSDPSADANQRGLISLQEVHESPVNTIAFNPFRQHLIASGGTEVAVHNLEKDIAEPDVFSPGSDVHKGSPITSVSWNRKVPHILGSASQNGVSVVWDLKLNKSIFNFSDPSKVNGNRNVCLSWSVDVPTQIACVYDDPKVPELQIWDLRNPKGPVFSTTKGHTKGIHYLDWSVTDPSLIVTVGRDNKVCIWNYKLASDNLVSEFTLDEPASQVKWSPKQPEIYSVSSASGNSTIYSLNNQLDHIPAWIRPPIGARFSFDGRLAVFSEKSGVSVQEYNVKSSDELIENHIEEFEKNFTSQQVDLDSLCGNKINSNLLDEGDKQEWQFIQAASKNDHDDIIQALGFDKDAIVKKAESYTGKSYTFKATKMPSQKTAVASTFMQLTADQANDFFDNLATRGATEADTGRLTASMADADDGEEDLVQENVVKNKNWNAGVERIIKNNILVGNMDGAIDTALKCGRVAEALLLAYSKGEDYFKSAIKAFVTYSNDPFVKNVINFLVEDQIQELVANYALEDWKECVALCISISHRDQVTFSKHMEQLATRFVQEKNDHNTALLCYILSRNFLRVLETFASASEKYQRGSAQYSIFLMNTVEKIIALKQVTGYYEHNPLVDRFLFDLSKVLHSFNRDGLILNLLTINDSHGFECLVIRDRLLNSSVEFQQQFAAKHFPFHREAVNIKAKKPVQTTLKKNFGEQADRKASTDGRGMPGQMGGPQQGGGHPPGGNQPPGGLKKPGPGGVPARLPFVPGANSNSNEQPDVNGMHRPSRDNIPPQNMPGKPPGPGAGGRPMMPNSNMFDPNKKKDDMLPPPVNRPSIGGMPPTRDFTSPNPNMSGTHEGFGTDGPNKTTPFTPNPSLSRSINEPTLTQSVPQNKGGKPGPVVNNPPSFKGPNFPKPIGSLPKPTNPVMGGPIGGHSGGPTGGPTGGFGGPSGPSGGFGGPTGPSGGFGGPSGPSSGFGGSNGPSSGSMGLPKPNIGGGPMGGNLGMNRGPSSELPKPPGSMGGPIPSNKPSFPGPSSMNLDKGIPKGGAPFGGPVQQKAPEPVVQNTVDYTPIYDTVARGLELLEQIDNNPKKKAENDQKIQQLYSGLEAGNIKQTTINDLFRLCQAIDSENLNVANTLQQKIAREDYVTNKDWLYVMRRIVQRK